MVIALVLLTLIICLAIDLIRTRRIARRAESPSTTQATASATRVLERYFHPGHSWAMVEGLESVKVGADDLVRRFAATLDRVEVPQAGTKVHQGEPLVTFRLEKRSLTLVSPVSGVLVEVNSRLAENPALVKESPYERGWVAKIAPSNLRVELRNLLKGALAERWRDGVQAQIAAWFSPRLGTAVLQDGGQWVDDLGSLVKDEEWEELAQTLFFIQPEQSNTQS